MKTLTLSALLCAMMALTRAAALPDTDDIWKYFHKVLTDAEAGPGTEATVDQGKSNGVINSTPCPDGWTPFNGRCFLYVAQAMNWTLAEENCMSLGGHLASVRNIEEYKQIQGMILKATYNLAEAWIGGSNAQMDQQWFWSDGSPFNFTRWCDQQPDNGRGLPFGPQGCLQMNHSYKKCWDDMYCISHVPSVCARDDK